MLVLKACPRCHGDLHRIDDLGVSYVSCLQCGQILTEQQEQALQHPTPRPAVRLARPRRDDLAA